MPTSKIVKRTGDVVAFEPQRIESAIARALEATGDGLLAFAAPCPRSQGAETGDV